MINYTSIDKNAYTGATPADVVRDMRAQSFDGQRLELSAFMRRTAATASTWAKQPIRAEKPEEFLEDLVAAGILKTEPATRERDGEQVD